MQKVDSYHKLINETSKAVSEITNKISQCEADKIDWGLVRSLLQRYDRLILLMNTEKRKEKIVDNEGLQKAIIEALKMIKRERDINNLIITKAGLPSTTEAQVKDFWVSATDIFDVIRDNNLFNMDSVPNPSISIGLIMCQLGFKTLKKTNEGNKRFINVNDLNKLG
jgi:hypothetical protein